MPAGVCFTRRVAALYRKYRPQTFDEVVGQEAVVRTLTNAIEQGKVRRIGLSKVPLICAREMEVPGALPRVIRLMLHCYASEDSEPQHVYLREAVSLRTDLQGAQ